MGELGIPAPGEEGGGGGEAAGSDSPDLPSDATPVFADPTGPEAKWCPFDGAQCNPGCPTKKCNDDDYCPQKNGVPCFKTALKTETGEVKQGADYAGQGPVQGDAICPDPKE